MNTHSLKLLAINGYGVAECDVLTMLDFLSVLDKDKNEVYIVSKPRGETYEKLRQIPGLRLVSMELGGDEAAAPGHESSLRQLVDFFLSILRIAGIVIKNRIDVLYVIDRGVSPQLAAVVSLLTGRPFVLNASYPYYAQNGWKARFVLRQAAKIHVHSQFLLDKLKPAVKAPGKFTVIQWGFDIEPYRLDIPRQEVRKSFGIASDAPLAVMTRVINPYKGQDDLIMAAAIVLQQRPDAQFLIGGHGSDDVLAYLAALIEELGVGQNVRLIGYTPNVQEFFSMADMVVMPSHEEPFGIIALQGMAMAKPIVATKAGGVPEFVHEGEMGLLVPPKDPESLAKAILYLICNPEVAVEMGKAGRRHFEDHHQDWRFAGQVEKVLREAANR